MAIELHMCWYFPPNAPPQRRAAADAAPPELQACRRVLRVFVPRPKSLSWRTRHTGRLPFTARRCLGLALLGTDRHDDNKRRRWICGKAFARL